MCRFIKYWASKVLKKSCAPLPSGEHMGKFYADPVVGNQNTQQGSFLVKSSARHSIVNHYRNKETG